MQNKYREIDIKLLTILPLSERKPKNGKNDAFFAQKLVCSWSEEEDDQLCRGKTFWRGTTVRKNRQTIDQILQLFLTTVRKEK